MSLNRSLKDIGLAESGPDQWKIGLRETPADAVDRESRIHGSVSKDTHMIVEICFASLGVAYYTTLCQGSDYSFKSTLQKKSYTDTTGPMHSATL